MPNHLNDLTLVLLHNSDSPPTWMDIWEKSYPLTYRLGCHAQDDIATWQQQINTLISTIYSQNIAIIAHDIAALACAAWQYQCHLSIQKRICAVILVSTPQAVYIHDDQSILQRCRFYCPTAFVIGQNDPACPKDWAKTQAAQWRARLLISPQQGHLNQINNGWQWGMQLLQEMLI